jgi:hypothetical protein
MKVFLGGYISMFLWFAFKNYDVIPQVMVNIFKSFWSGSWSSMMGPMIIGIRTAIYTNDIAIGYEGVMETYSQVRKENFVAYCYNIVKSNIVDASICTISGLFPLIFSLKNNINIQNLPTESLIVEIFNSIIPYNLGYLIFGFFVCCVAFTTVATYAHAGSLVFNYYLPHLSKKYFYWIACFIFILTVGINGSTLFDIMSLAGALIIAINCLAIVTYILKNDFQKI